MNFHFIQLTFPTPSTHHLFNIVQNNYLDSDSALLTIVRVYKLYYLLMNQSIMYIHSLTFNLLNV